MSELPTCPGVYLLTHDVTGDTYVGKAENIRVRIQAHLAKMRSGSHENAAVEALCKAHGPHFTPSVLCETTREGRRAAELEWITKVRPTLNHRDIAKLGYRPVVPMRSRLPRKGPGVTMNVRVDRETETVLKKLAKEDDRTTSFIIAKAIREYLARHPKPRPNK